VVDGRSAKNDDVVKDGLTEEDEDVDEISSINDNVVDAGPTTEDDDVVSSRLSEEDDVERSQ
jgi:hypothetical protein